MSKKRQGASKKKAGAKKSGPIAPPPSTPKAEVQATAPASVEAPLVVEDTPVIAPEPRPDAHDDADADRAFFDGERAAVARLHAQELHEASRVLELEPPKLVVTKEMLARRKNLRRVVSAVVGFAAVLTALATVRVLKSAHRTPGAETFSTIAVAHAEPLPPAPTTEPKSTESVDSVKQPNPPDPPIPATSPATSGKADQLDSVKSPPTIDTQEPAAAEPPKPALDAKMLTKKALRALESGKMADAIEAGKAAVDADPTDANPYLYWGTALLETGKSAAAKAVFGQCVEQATHGPKNECRQFK